MRLTQYAPPKKKLLTKWMGKCDSSKSPSLPLEWSKYFHTRLGSLSCPLGSCLPSSFPKLVCHFPSHNLLLMQPNELFNHFGTEYVLKDACLLHAANYVKLDVVFSFDFFFIYYSATKRMLLKNMFWFWAEWPNITKKPASNSIRFFKNM